MNEYRPIDCLTAALPAFTVASEGQGSETHYAQRTE